MLVVSRGLDKCAPSGLEWNMQLMAARTQLVQQRFICCRVLANKNCRIVQHIFNK